MRTEDKIRIILDALHASQEVKDAMQDYIYDLVETAYSRGYEDRKCGLDKHRQTPLTENNLKGEL